MIREGDRVLLGVSGGKDSLSLLQVLRHLQKKAPVAFDLGVPGAVARPCHDARVAAVDHGVQQSLGKRPVGE